MAAALNNGLGSMLTAIAGLPADKRAAVEADIAACYDSPTRPGLAMVGWCNLKPVLQPVEPPENHLSTNQGP